MRNVSFFEQNGVKTTRMCDFESGTSKGVPRFSAKLNHDT